ncbi:rod shape-determining protein MreD [Nonomuraea rhodomycinica]|uniref:Rod shape-determining protein MreD n=1 Tax=Nonomuraea rhodomycinica TaxID=1712872 RepID=A0A7Y6IU79_9ACTN|nr:rod shape-determining protein MreD [Nonomuraea rhodomycinica]NUW43164.1 rod shape-determining protein MreD [Nonomuraea rhodomycinica]
MTALLIVPLAVLVQVILVNRVPLPGGGSPDLVLLAVTGVAMARGPVTGAVIGFCAGLLVDVMPPAAHLMGLYAFTLAVIGYVAGRGLGTPVTTVMLCVLLGPLLAAGLGGLISDPRVDVDTFTDQVPLTIAYTFFLSPLVMWWAARAGEPGYAT